MTTAFAYFIVAGASLWLCHRLLQTLSRRAALALLLLPLCFTGRALLSGRVYAPIDLPLVSEPLNHVRPGVAAHNAMLSDVYSLNIPWKAAVRYAYAHGEWPLWNPFNFAGDILAASAQPTPYEPIFLSSLLLPLPNSLTYLAAMTFFLAGLLMFVFLRELGCSELASLAGAAAWMYSSFLVFWLGWVIAPSTVWFPLILTGVCRTVRERSLRAMAILTVAFAMMLLNGHPETALHATALGAIWAVGELWIARGRHFVRVAGLGVAAGALALLMTAMFMLPVIEAIAQTQEHLYRKLVFAHQKKAAPLRTALEHLEFQVLPFRYGDPSAAMPRMPPSGFPENSYVGSTALAAALLGLWRSPRRTKWMAASFVLIGWVIGNSFGPFIDWLDALPLFDIALNTRLIFAASFGLAVLTALGVDVARDANERGRLAIVSGGLLVVLGALCIKELGPMHAIGLQDGFIRQRIAALLLPLLILTIVAATGKQRASLIAIFLLILTQRTSESGAFYPTVDADLFYPRIPILDHLPKSIDPYRIVGQGLMFYPNMSSIYAVEDIRGYQAMTNYRFHTMYPLWCVTQPIWFNRVDDLTRPFLSMMNVRFALVSSGTIPPEGWQKIAESGGTQLFENLRVLPRAFVPRHIRINTATQDIGREMEAATDFMQTGWINIENEPDRETQNGTGTVTIQNDGMRKFVMHASIRTPTWIIVTETAWKGWRAYVDGKATTVHRANHAFLAVGVPPGEHEVRLVYWPRSFVIGRWLSTATLLAIGVFILLRRR